MQKKCWMLSASVLSSLTRSGRTWRRREKLPRKNSSNFRTASALYVQKFNIGNQIDSIHQPIEQYLKYLYNKTQTDTSISIFQHLYCLKLFICFSWNQIYNLFLNVRECFWLNIGTGWLVQERAGAVAEDWWSIGEQPESPETREGQNKQKSTGFCLIITHTVYSVYLYTSICICVLAC